jgi:PilZ domain
VKAQWLRERRRVPRYPHIVDIDIRVLPPLGARNYRCATFHGHTENVSSAGVCLLTDFPLENASLLRCNVALPYTQVGFPTLMQVRWTRESRVTLGTYTSGLQFVF